MGGMSIVFSPRVKKCVGLEKYFESDVAGRKNRRRVWEA